MSTNRSRSHLGAVGLALLVTFLWSTSWILVRWGLDDEGLKPVSFAALRYGTAALVLLAWVLPQAQKREALRRLDRRVIGRALILGIVLYTLTQGAQFIAIDNQPAASTSLVLSASPMVVALASSRSLAEPSSPRQILGAALVALGAALYFAGGLSFTTIGMAAAVVALGANAGGAILGRRANRDGAVPAVLITALSMSVGAVGLAAVGLAVEGWPSVSARAWLIIVWLAVLNTALAFTLWNVSLRRLSAVESSGINNTMLMQIALLAWWLLGERPGVGGVAGIIFVSAGIVLTQMRGQARLRAPARP